MEFFLFFFGLILGAGLMFFPLIIVRVKHTKIQLKSEAVERDQKGLLSENQEYKKEKEVWIEQSASLKTNLEKQKQMYEDKLNSQKNYYEDKIQERREHFETLDKKSKDVFENIANKIVLESRERSTKNISQILEPFKKDIDTFKKSVDGQEKFLSETITTFTTINSKMRDEANKLTQALKGDIKVQGNWGEVVLGNILEKSGLREGEDFFLQAKGLKLKDEDSSSLKPDAVVKLPEDKYFVIDSKVSFTYYEEYISSNTEEHLIGFLNSVSTHIDNLSAKKYEFAEDIKTSGFTLMFIPNEGMFSLAIQNKRGLFEKAWKNSIVIVGPTTLMATLRTVSSIWKIEKQNRYTKEIAKQGRLLYDRFVNFLEDMNKIDVSLKTARDSYDKALIKIRDGDRSLLKNSSRLQELEDKLKKKEKRLEKKEKLSKQKKQQIEKTVKESVNEKSLSQNVQHFKEFGVKPKKEIPDSFRV